MSLIIVPFQTYFLPVNGAGASQVPKGSKKVSQHMPTSGTQAVIITFVTVKVTVSKMYAFNQGLTNALRLKAVGMWDHRDHSICMESVNTQACFLTMPSTLDKPVAPLSLRQRQSFATSDTRMTLEGTFFPRCSNPNPWNL